MTGLGDRNCEAVAKHYVHCSRRALARLIARKIDRLVQAQHSNAPGERDEHDKCWSRRPFQSGLLHSTAPGERRKWLVLKTVL